MYSTPKSSCMGHGLFVKVMIMVIVIISGIGRLNVVANNMVKEHLLLASLGTKVLTKVL